MTEHDKLPDAELALHATAWRQRALHGDLHARGIAHELEAELRRRRGALFPDYDTLDMRSLEQRRPRWWRMWRQRGGHVEVEVAQHSSHFANISLERQRREDPL